MHADFWSLGVMLYEMVSGHRPYPQLEDPRLRRQLYSAITTNAPRAPLPPDCPPHLQAIIHRLLAFQPAHRYQSADEIHADLERYVRRETPVAVAYYDTPATPPVTRAGAGAVVMAPPVAVTELPGIAPPVPPTDPVPMSTAPGASIPAAGTAVAVRMPAAIRTSLSRRLAGAIGTVALIVIVATEGVAWLFAERFRDTVPAMDERTVISGRESDAVGAGHCSASGDRVGPLSALRAIGKQVIADYGAECPTMGRRNGARRARRSRGAQTSPHDKT